MKQLRRVLRNSGVKEEVDLQSEIERISCLTEHTVGSTEENVKQKIVVPVLQFLGHERENMEFEHRTRGRGKIDILLGKNLPSDCKVIIV